MKKRPSLKAMIAILIGGVMVSVFMVGCGVRSGPDPDVPLIGGYVLASYEDVNGDGYLVMRHDKVVVSTSVREIGTIDGKIVGRVEDAMVLALDRIQDGYFILDTSTGKLSAGLTKPAFEAELGTDIFEVLVPPSNWKR